MKNLRNYFLQAGFPEKEVQIIVDHFQCRSFEKGEFFPKEGKISQHLAFIETGAFQYFLQTYGEEKTTYIALENVFIASLLSYLREIPSIENIRSLTNYTIWVIHKNDVLKLQKEITGFKDFYINLLEWQICCIEKTRSDLLTLSAEERYKKLMEEEPQLLQQIPLQYIASMLGITPRHLSRLRNNI